MVQHPDFGCAARCVRGPLRRLFAAACGLLWFAGVSSAQMLDVDMPLTDGVVNAMTRIGDTVYLGGRFQYAGPFTGSFARLDASTGALVPGLPRVVGNVNAVVEDGVGGWFIGGDFTTVDGQPRNGLAHVHSDGSLSPWNPINAGTIRALARVGATLYVGGGINTLGSKARWLCGAVDTTTGIATDWNPGATGYDDDDLRSLVVSGDVVYLGGRFRWMGGQTRTSLAAVDRITGAALPWSASVYSDFEYGYPGLVARIVVDGSNVYVAGDFSHVAAQPRTGLAVIDASTGALAAWDPAADGSVEALVPHGSRVYVGGSFTHVGGQARAGLAELDATTGLATAWNPCESGSVYGMLLSGADLYVSGQFGRIGGQDRRNFAVVDVASGAAGAWDPRGNAAATHLLRQGDMILASGGFTSLGGVPRASLAAVNLATRQVLEWGPAVEGQVLTLSASPTTIYVGGQFTAVGGELRNNLAAVDIASGVVTPWNPDATDPPYAGSSVVSVVCSGTKVYAAGFFSRIGGETRNRLAALDAATGAVTEWNPNVSGSVECLFANDTTLYVGGYFTNIGGLPRSNLAAIGMPSGLVTQWNPGANSTVQVFAVRGAVVYAGGSFTSCGGQARTALAAIDAVTGVASTWNARVNGSVTALAVSGSALYLGGSFGRLGTTNRTNLAAVDVTTGLPTAWNPLAFGVVQRLEVRGSSLLVAGTFSRIGASPAFHRPGFAVFAGLGDVTPPQVRVLTPNGHETFFLGQTRELAWSATDETGVKSVGLYLSRTGPQGPWQLLYWNVPAVGSQWWPVTGPAVNDDVYLRVEATDFNGNTAADVSDAAWSVSDQSVPTLVELFRATAVEGGVRIEWRLGGTGVWQSVVLERANAPEDAWTVVAADPLSHTSVVDAYASDASERWYRLRGVANDGRSITLGTISVQLFAPVTAVDLSPLAPNPSVGRATVTFALPVRTRVRLSVTDLQGRELALLSDGMRDAGRHTAMLTTDDLPPGLYFLRLQTGGVDRTRRFSVVR